MILFKTVEEIQKYNKVNGSTKLSSLEGFERDAIEKYIQRYIGTELLDALTEYHNAEDPTADEALDKLRPYVQAALARFTYYLAIPSLDVNVSESGIGVISSDKIAPASKDRVASFRESILQLGWDSIESLLKFLEKNKADYESWTSSEAYTIQTGLFINSAEEFNKHVNINDSVLKFIELKQNIEDVELLKIYPAITSELAEEIKEQIKADELSDANKKILLYIRKATAHFAGIEAKLLTASEIKANHFITEVIRIMEANREDYPLYAASIEEVTSYKNYENTEDSSIMVFGG